MIQERMYSANEYAEARDRILTLEAEVERLNQGLAAMVMSTTYRCTHCGVRPQSEEALREHCRTCPKHPARAEVEQLKAELAGCERLAEARLVELKRLVHLLAELEKKP